MSFSYKGIAKKCTRLSNEFLLQACGQTDIRTDRQTDIRTDIYPPLEKRYSRIISTICGPNNKYTRILLVGTKIPKKSNKTIISTCKT